MRVTLFRQSDFNLTNLELTVKNYSSPNNYYIQARAIYLTKGSTISDKIKDRARSLAINTRTNRNTSVNYIII